MNKRISEEDADFKSVREEWAKRAKACRTTDDLKAFVDELLLMWMFIRQFGSHGPDAILHLKDWSNALYPQYEPEFAHTMHPKTWDRLRELAKEKIAEAGGRRDFVHANVLAHWESIADGKVPFGLTISASRGS